MSEFRSLLSSRLSGLRELASSELEALETHYLVLREWNRRLNLTTIRDLEAVVERHYCESVFLARHLPPGPLEVIDVGSGPGFPGFPIAVVRPDCRVALVESSSKKAVFLRESTRHVENVRVIEGRAEVLPLKGDWIVARAVRWRDIVGLVPQLAGHVALLLGESDSRELAGTQNISWASLVLLPWGSRRMLATGFHVEHGGP